MAKSMPLPPAAPDDGRAHGKPEEAIPGFSGVVSKIPTPPPRRPYTDAEADAVNGPAAVARSAAIPCAGDDSDGDIDIPIDLIDKGRYQPRTKIDEDAIGRLADSMATRQINAIIVRKTDNGRYELIAGERRWRAKKLLGHPTIRAKVCVLTDAQAILMALTDNEAREDLSDFERGMSYRGLLAEKIVASQVELARVIGKERTFVVRCLAYFKLPPEVLLMLETRQDLFGSAYAQSFASIMDANEGKEADLIIDAVRKIFEGKLDPTNALNWLKGQVRARRFPKLTPAIQTFQTEGRHIGEIKTDGRKVVITCAEGVSPDEVINLILLGKTAPPQS
jgi:ParB family chromosome partitioning protein